MNKRHGWQLIFFLAFLGLVCVVPLRFLKPDLRPEKLFRPADADVSFYRTFQHQFYSEANEEYIFIGLGNDEGLFKRNFLGKVDSLTRYLTGLAHVVKV